VGIVDASARDIEQRARAVQRHAVRTSNPANALGLLLNLADQESATAECPTRKGSPAYSDALTSPLLLVKWATYSTTPIAAMTMELSRL
jgi:hypothetical protein